MKRTMQAENVDNDNIAKDKSENTSHINEISENVMKPPTTPIVLKSHKFNMDFCCHICEMAFPNRWQLKYHIRLRHFNLKAKVPYCEAKQINQVWFEKVLNSDDIVEIKKTGINSLLMRKLSSDAKIEIKDTDSRELDLTDVYPVKRSFGRPKKTIDLKNSNNKESNSSKYNGIH